MISRRSHIHHEHAHEAARGDHGIVWAQPAKLNLALQILAQHTEKPARDLLVKHFCDLWKPNRLGHHDAYDRDVAWHLEYRQVGSAEQRQPFTRRQLHQPLGVIGQLKDGRALANDREKQIFFVLEIPVDQAR